MNNNDFENVLRDRIEKIILTLQLKAGEYSRDCDRLHNFNAAGAMLRITPEKALLGMLSKHLVSVVDLVDGIDYLNQEKAEYLINEKIGDSINYLILLEALLLEKKGLVKSETR